MVPARCSLVTLGVSDVARSKAFYRALGWEAGIDMDDFAVFRTAGPLLALYPIEDMSRDAGDEVPPDRTRRIHLAINLDSPREVDEAVVEFLAAGAALLRAPEAADWGGYTSIVADPDGHAWEIAHNPGWPLGEDGLPQLP
jgi:catechol 2,3-dioxygenase-like lactoylglutathione lyase family enzyme